MRTKNPNAYWSVPNETLGVRIFPRCGSRTFAENYTRANDFGEFLVRPNKVCVVRDPYKRLLSAWYGLKRFRGRHWPDFDSLEEFIAWLVQQDPYVIDVHIAPMSSFLDGFWWPEPHQVMLLEDFYKNPPYGLPPISHHWHLTEYPEIEPIKLEVLTAFMLWAKKDFTLFEYAQKSPLVTGGKQATDDGHEKS